MSRRNDSFDKLNAWFAGIINGSSSTSSYPQTIGQEGVNDMLRHALRFYRVDDWHADSQYRNSAKDALMPIEFSVAAYRFGHSQVRPSYRLNFGSDGGTPFFAFVVDDSLSPADPNPNDLRGGKRASRRFVVWQTFFDFGNGNVRSNKRIDSNSRRFSCSFGDRVAPRRAFLRTACNH
jgi:hypothetical protein